MFSDAHTIFYFVFANLFEFIPIIQGFYYIMFLGIVAGVQDAREQLFRWVFEFCHSSECSLIFSLFNRNFNRFYF
jgi:hypothetical protein